jgi:hypothetical protein
MYGGITTADYKASGDVYILSLPGFVFFKATPSSSSTKRAEHACILAGNRQMLSVGGIDVDLSFPEIFFDPDPWKNGLGVLDLTALTWNTRYDATARPYESPKVVRQWYAKGGLASVKWTSDTVRGLFAQTAPPGTTSNPTKPPTDDRPSTGTPDPQDPGNGGGSSTSDNNTARLIGSVVGGVVGLIMLGIIVWWLWRRPKKPNDASRAREEHPGSPNATSTTSQRFLSRMLSPHSPASRRTISPDRMSSPSVIRSPSWRGRRLRRSDGRGSILETDLGAVARQ